ncbi:MAG: glutamine amidotransferase [bacterium]
MLRTWFDHGDDFNAAHLVLLSDWGLLALIAVALLVLGGLALTWHNTRELTGRRRWILRGLRAVAVGLLVLLFLQPGVRLENVTRVRNHVVVLLDASRSMGLPGEGGTRLDDVKALLAREAAVINGWKQDHQVDFFAVTDQARPLADPAGITAEGDATRLLSGLEDVAARFRPEEVAAVVVISDGADNGALGEAVPVEEAPPAAVAVARRLQAPIHTLFTGPREPPRDVAISRVAYDDFAFVRNAVTIEAEITVQGYSDLVLPVTLRRGDTILGQRLLATEPGKDRYAFDFEFVPDKTGKDVFTLEVGQAPNEEIRDNNRRQFVIRIIRDKIRVLQVVGRPSWDVRFLRKLLKKNPNVDLISFFILRTGASIDVARRDELSLIPFPTQELFEEQLGSFDLIVFQNFTYRGYQMIQYLPLIREYVRNGGGFVMIGGDLSFTSGGYAGTPIADFLPVDLPPEGGDLIDEGRFRPTLTEAGRRHPITSLSLVPEENAQLWATLPELSGINRVLGVREGAVVLAQHPGREAGGAPAPVIVAQEFGQGRVLAVTTDSTWSWAFQAAADGGDNRHYYKLWGNAIRWLIQDPALKPVRVEADRDRYPLGTEVTLLTRVVGADWAPAVDTPVTIEVRRAWFDAGGLRQTEVVTLLEGRTSENGEYLARYLPAQPGAYTVTARVDRGTDVVTDEDVFVVAPDPIELRETAARADTLKALAQAGGGEARTLDQGLDGLDRVEPAVVKVNRRKDVPLWSSGWLLLLAVLFPSAEWFLRRRWGLL